MYYAEDRVNRGNILETRLLCLFYGKKIATLLTNEIVYVICNLIIRY